MKNSFFRQIIFFVLFITLVSFNSCTKKEVVEEIPVPKWQPVENHIALLFGYGYNDKAFVDSICSKLAEEYGLEKENGLIQKEKVRNIPTENEIKQNDKIAIVGRNGSGKTSLLNALVDNELLETGIGLEELQIIKIRYYHILKK